MNQITVKRFWDKVLKTEGCWVWTGSKRNKGYGAFVYPGNHGDIVQGRAHRFSWEFHYGKIPEGVCVLHHCDNPACVRPDHLFLGTKADNNRDMVKKGRHVSGGTHCGKNGKWKKHEKHWNSKLTEENVRQIRDSYASGMVSCSDIAKKYHVVAGHVRKIIQRKAWKNL